MMYTSAESAGEGTNKFQSENTTGQACENKSVLVTNTKNCVFWFFRPVINLPFVALCMKTQLIGFIRVYYNLYATSSAPHTKLLFSVFQCGIPKFMEEMVRIRASNSWQKLKRGFSTRQPFNKAPKTTALHSTKLCTILLVLQAKKILLWPCLVPQKILLYQ